METLEIFNPCDDCRNRTCGLVDGQECEKAIKFRSIQSEHRKLKEEIRITREYIHSCNLEWDLLSYAIRKGS